MANRINLDKRGQLLAANRCCECGYQWRDQPFGHARYPACPKCGSAYWVWLNYDNDD